MKSIDYRNLTWDSIQETLTGLRLQVLDAWRAHGPATTRELSRVSGIDILTLRPRTTELLDLGLLELVQANEERTCRQQEGVYRARTVEAVRHWLECKRHEPAQRDLDLRLEGGAPC